MMIAAREGLALEVADLQKWGRDLSAASWPVAEFVQVSHIQSGGSRPFACFEMMRDRMAKQATFVG
jgi:hypothetical protein